MRLTGESGARLRINKATGDPLALLIRLHYPLRCEKKLVSSAPDCNVTHRPTIPCCD